MTEHEALGLSINVYRPTFAPYKPTASELGNFLPDTYEHTLSAGVGFDTLSASRAVAWEEAYWWLDNACGAHVVVKDQTGLVVWEGRVDTASLSAGGYSVQRGPVTAIANRCVVTYQLLDPTTGEGQEQKRTSSTSAAANNTKSQAKYGIQCQVLSAGTRTTANANQIRAAYVVSNAWPRIPKQLALGGQAAALRLDCRGYYYWLSYPYSLVNVTGTVTVTAKIAAVLAADPNALFGGPNQIATNALTVQALEDQDRLASEIIADVTALGDATYNRYLFGVWENRAVRYEAAPTSAEYQQRTDDQRQVVEDMAGHVVPPWAVRPGKWLTFTSILPGSLVGLGMVGMPETERSMFVETVKYTSPYGLNMGGGEVNTARQRLAQWGITGI